MPPNFQPDQQNMPVGQNMRFPPGMIPMPMQMFKDPKTGQWHPVPVPGFPNMPQPAEGGRGPPGNDYIRLLIKLPQTSPQIGSFALYLTLMPFLSSHLDDQRETGSEEQEEDDGQKGPDTEDRPAKIIVTNLPSTVHEEYLEMFFENKNKYGGGSVVNIEYDEEDASVVVEFEELDAVDIVLQKQPIKMMGVEVDVEVYVPVPEEPVSMCTIEVTGPPNVVCEEKLETLQMYFEHKKSLGDEVEEIRFDGDLAYVTFYSEEVAGRVVEKNSHVINKKPIQVKLHIPEKAKKQKMHGQTGDSKRERDHMREKEEEPMLTVKVKGMKQLPPRDTIEFYFDNKRRSGGYDLEEIKTDDEDDDIVYVKYKSEEVARAVAERSHKLEGINLSVSLYTPPKPPPSYPDKILIKGLKTTTTEDCLFNFIEAKSGYIPVPGSMTFYAEQEGVVMVTLENEPDFERLEKMCEKSKLDGAKLKISPVPLSNCIIVSNLAADVTKDTVAFYFENKRKSNGGPVAKVVMNEDDTCIVFFEDYQVAGRVVEKNSHVINKKPIQVKLNIPEKAKKQKLQGQTGDSKRGRDDMREKEEEHMLTVKVKGIKQLSSRDTIEFYFDNKRKSGGYDLEEIKTDDEDDDIVYVKYKSEEVARTVTERSHKLEGINLSVSLYTPLKPPPSYPDKILIKGLKTTTTEDCLFNFIEAKSGYIPVPGSMTFHAEQEGVVMVTLENEPDFERLEKMCEKTKLDGAKLKISPVPLSNCIIVSNLADVTKDTVEFYFENKRKSNGGPIAKVVMNEDDTCCVFFEDYQVARRVAERSNHLINSKTIHVELHIPETKKQSMQGQTGDSKKGTDEMSEKLQEVTLLKVKANGIPPKDTIEFYSKTRREGYDLQEIKTDDENDDIEYVKYQSKKVAQRVVDKPDHNVNKQGFSVQPTKNKKADKKKEIEKDKEKEVENPETIHEPVCSIKMKGRKALLSTETFKYDFWDRKRSACGEFECLMSDEVEGDAIHITKKSEEDEKYGQYQEEPAQEPPEKPTKIVVSNLPSSVHYEFLEMFFESTKKYGGGPVKNVELDEEANSAIIEFEDPEAVEVVLSKCPLKIMGQSVEVEVYVPEPPAPLCTIQVCGPPDIINQTETLEMYFENERKSHGGSVKDIRYGSQGDLVYVTFGTEEVAQRVAEKPDHNINKRGFSVQLFKPGKDTKKAKKKEKEKKKEEEAEDTETIHEPLCSVKVKGVTAIPSRETFELYFENTKRSGGGDFESLMNDEVDEDVVYITYKSEKVAKAVANKNHILEGCELQVSLYVPPKPVPNYDYKVIIKGLNPQTTQDCLFNFIEAKSDFVPESMVYHSQQEGVVMVTMEASPDFKYGELEKIFATTKLEGNALKLARVPISNCIMVSNLADEVTKDTVEFYFENKRKSGGGKVSKVVMNEDSTCFVYFEDYKTIDSVLNRKHKLSEETLLVQRYQECLGRPEGDMSERNLKVPDPLVLKNVDSQKIKFMNHSKVNQEMIRQQLRAVYSNIVWPELPGAVLLECTLTKEDTNSFKLVKTWKADAQKNFEDFMKTIVVHKIDVLQDIWQKIIKQLSNINITKPEAVALFVEKKDGMITIVGNKPVADSLAKQLFEIKKQAMDELEKEKKTVKEVVTAFKQIEKKMLVADKYPNKMEEKFEGLRVKVNLNKNEITFEGHSASVQNAKLEMYELKSSYECQPFGKLSEQKRTLYQSKVAKEIIVKKLKNKNLTATWEVQSGELVVCSKREDLEDSAFDICESVKENSISLREAARSVMNSENWSTEVDKLHRLYQGKCEIAVSEDISKVLICATDDILDKVVDSVKKFLLLNTVLVEKVACTKNAHRLIERYHKEELNRISGQLQNSHVQVTSLVNYGGFEVRGTEDGINTATEMLRKVLNKIKKREHTMNKPGLADHMDTSKGKESLNTIESIIRCVVTVKGNNGEAQADMDLYDTNQTDTRVSKNFGVKGLNVVARCKFSDSICVNIVRGDMTELSVDVLVNPADDKISLTGGLGKAIVSKGGREIERECKAHIQIESRLEDGQAFFSTAGNLNVKYIAHVRGPVWKQGNDNEDQKLNEAVSKCLQTASFKNALSIAIPAISCGNYGYPVKHATRTIVKAVKNFFLQERNSSVRDIYLCDVKANTVECFSEAVGREFGKHNFQTYSSRQESRNRDRPSPHSEPTHSDEEIEPMDTDEENNDENYESPSQLRKPLPGAMKVLPPPVPKPRSTQQHHSKEVKIGNISVTVVKGELAKQQVDVIVNTTSKTLDLKNGAVSASLLKAGGHDLQQEVSTKYPDGINDGEIAITSGQRLKCSMVIHSSMANWDGNNAESCTTALHKLMKNCMDAAEGQDFKSIAFPAIGTGNLGFPRDVVATEMFNAVGKFSAKSLKEVRLIVYQKDYSTIQAFENELERCRRGNARQSRKYNLYEDLHKKRFSSASAGGDDDVDENTYEFVSESDQKDPYYKIGNISVVVKQGDITKEDAKCIVNSSNEALDLSRGAVSKALLKEGGTLLQAELDKLRKKMRKDHCVISTAPGLPCDKIIHIVAKETTEEWKQIITKCLNEAERNSLKSIAFPALGTGLQMEAGNIAKIMVRAVSEFETSKPKSLTDIRFVIYQTEMVEEFHKAIRNNEDGGQGWSIGGIFKAFRGYMTGQSDQGEPVYAKPKERKSHSKVTFLILAMSENSIDLAVKKLESCLEKEVHKKEFRDSIIKKMDDNQLLEIRAIAEQHHLDVKLDARNGIIEVSGIATNLITATDKIHSIMRDAVSFEQQKNSADLMSNIVQWMFIEINETGQNLQPYEKDLNYRIENAYKNQAPNLIFSADQISYKLDFGKMEEYPIDHPDDKVTVIRKDLIKQSSFGAFEPPASWGDMSGNLRVVVLQAGTPEYQDIAQKFAGTSGGSFTVSKIERVQNKTLWQQYQAKKKQLEDQNPQGTQNERLLWHGTAPEAVDNINAHGFNRSYCGKNATAYGDGVYFAVNANYSCSNTYSRPDASGVKRVYFCRVLTGEYTKGQGGMRVPPQKAGGVSTALYDSVVDNPNGPGMYIIFHDTQAYPEYLLSFN